MWIEENPPKKRKMQGLLSDGHAEKISQCLSMGFDEVRSKAALERFDYNVERAVEWMMTNPAGAEVGAGAPTGDSEMQKAIQASLNDAPQQTEAEQEAQLQQVLIDSMADAAATGSAQRFDFLSVNYSPAAMQRADADLPVGIQNVGNTCYVNTFLQLFYNIPAFRSVVNSVHSPSEFMKALQLTFARMQLADVKFIDPKEVLQSMKDSSGNVYKVGEQEDVTEFNDRFLTAVEGALKEMDDAGDAGSLCDELKRLVEGQISEAYRVAGAGAGEDIRKVNTDKFRAVVLAVQPHSESLHDLLEGHTMCETIEGYKFEVPVPGGREGDVEERVATAEKAVWFEGLPDVLIFQLQRAAYISGEVTKNNQVVQCPFTLNMDRYLHENAVQSLKIREVVNQHKQDLAACDARISTLTDVQGTKRSLPELLQIITSQLGEGAQDVGLDVDDTAQKFKAWADAQQARIDLEREQEAAVLKKIQHAYDSIKSPTPNLYELCGILVHDGAGAQSGHYWACIRNPDTAAWYKYNDINVTRVTDEEVQVLAGQVADKAGPAPSTAYCLVYARAAAASAASQPQDVYANQVAEENAKHKEELRKWEDAMLRIPALVDKRRKEVAAAYVEKSHALRTNLTPPWVLDRFIVSTIDFASAKYGEWEDVMKVLAVAEAYKDEFGSELIVDWQGKDNSAQAEKVAQDGGVLSLLYATKTSINGLKASHETYVKMSIRYLNALAMMSGTLDKPEHFLESQQDVWEYVRERDRLDECWKVGTQLKFNVLLVEFLVRWLAAVEGPTKTTFEAKHVAEPVGYIGRLALSLPLDVRDRVEAHVLQTLQAAMSPILASIIGAGGIAAAYRGGKNPPATHGKGLTLHAQSTADLAEEIRSYEERFFDSAGATTATLCGLAHR